MPNGKPGDHPVTDLFAHGAHPFPEDIEGMIRELVSLNPKLLDEIEEDVFRWEAGQGLDEGRVKLKELLAKAVPNPVFSRKQKQPNKD